MNRAQGLLVGALGLICAATLLPASIPEGIATGAFFDAPSPPDAVANLFLFLPLGAALAARRTRPAPSTAVGAGLSVAIEVAQWWIPGRQSSPWDCAANAAGVALGHAVFLHWRSILVEDPPLAAVRWAIAGVMSAGLLGSSFFMTPYLPSGSYFGHLAPDLPHLAPYPGPILEAKVAGVALTRGRLANAESIREALAGDFRAVVEAVGADSPSRLAAFVLLTDEQDHDVFLIGRRANSVRIASLAWGHRFGLAGGRRSIPKTLTNVEPGERIRVEVERRNRDLCVAVNGPLRCGFGFRVSEGWTLLLDDAGIPEGVRMILGLLWLGGLFGMFALCAVSPLHGPLPWIVVTGSFVVSAFFGPVLPPHPAEWLAVIVGVAGGRITRTFASKSTPPARSR